MSLLTEQEITEIVREAARGSATRRDGSTSQRIARAIESAVLAKIKAQGPEVWMAESGSTVLNEDVEYTPMAGLPCTAFQKEIEMLDNGYQQLIANSIAHAAEMANENIRAAASRYETPSVLFRPKLFVDGDQWCALYGENLQDGVTGFGKSPANAMLDFDKNWNAVMKEIEKCHSINGCVLRANLRGTYVF